MVSYTFTSSWPEAGRINCQFIMKMNTLESCHFHSFPLLSCMITNLQGNLVDNNDKIIFKQLVANLDYHSVSCISCLISSDFSTGRMLDFSVSKFVKLLQNCYST